jgi:transcriptional regulator with XRE-family HTH domain
VSPVSTPLGDFVRAKRDAIRPESVGLAAGRRRRVPGLRRSELASLAGISVDYLVRIEQGRDHAPSVSVVNALAEALRLDGKEREHLRHLAKRASATCLASLPEPGVAIRSQVRAVLTQLEPGIALVTNRLGDVLAYTSGFELLARPTGLLDAPLPNLTRYVFTDDRARSVFPDWERIADDRAFDVWLSPSAEQSERLVAELTALAGEEFTGRLQRNPGHDGKQTWLHPMVGELWFDREVLELPAADGQQLVVLLPADEATAETLNQMRRRSGGSLHAVN